MIINRPTLILGLSKKQKRLSVANMPYWKVTNTEEMLHNDYIELVLQSGKVSTYGEGCNAPNNTYHLECQFQL